MKHNQQQSQKNNPVQQEQESDVFRILLNAPNMLAKLVDTAVLLTLLTGMLYDWGASYYFGFIEGVGLKKYGFAFNIPPNDILFGGANALVYVVAGAPAAYISVGLILGVIIGLIFFIQVVMVPLLARLGSWARNHLSKRKALKRAAGHVSQQAKINETDLTITQLGSSIETYVAHGIILFLLLLLLIWGTGISFKIGREVAKEQLGSSPHVEVIYGENEKIETTLCGRIGSDFILRSDTEPGEYIILKESIIKKITVTSQAAQAKR